MKNGPKRLLGPVCPLSATIAVWWKMIVVLGRCSKVAAVAQQIWSTMKDRFLLGVTLKGPELLNYTKPNEPRHWHDSRTIKPSDKAALERRIRNVQNSNEGSKYSGKGRLRRPQERPKSCGIAAGHAQSKESNNRGDRDSSYLITRTNGLGGSRIKR
jgi:hypothetical protein